MTLFYGIYYNNIAVRCSKTGIKYGGKKSDILPEIVLGRSDSIASFIGEAGGSEGEPSLFCELLAITSGPHTVAEFNGGKSMDGVSSDEASIKLFLPSWSLTKARLA